MKILFAASEGVPFAKSGGLGDVIGSLPKALNRLGQDVRVVLPLYQKIKDTFGDQLTYLGNLTVPLAWRNQYCGLFRMEYEGVVTYFIDNEQYFKREKFYGYYDDGERFAFFPKAVLECLPLMDFQPDIIHCHDWQTALLPVFHKVFYGEESSRDRKILFTIHNIEYQGRYGRELADDVLGLPDWAKPMVDMDGDVNYMKGAIEACDGLTTVSPTYSQELTYDFYGAGLASVIRKNQYKFRGILNGIDTELFNSSTDPALAERYTAASLGRKKKNKAALQAEVGLEVREDVPLFAIVSRLASHKGIDLVQRIFPDLMAKPLQLMILGSGEPFYEDFFGREAADYAGKAAFRGEFSTTLANKIYGGADFLLMPSISEPCGLSQMIALRYGTIPIVRETGGLRDSVVPFNPQTGEGDGITFSTVNAHDLLFAVGRGEELFHSEKDWGRIRKNAMKGDHSWAGSAEEYIRLYKEISSK